MKLLKSENQYHQNNLFAEIQNRIGKISADIDRSIPFDMIIKDVESLIAKADYPPDYEINIIGEEENVKRLCRI